MQTALPASRPNHRLVSGEGFMSSATYPMLYEINTRVWLTELSGQLARSATLDDIPDGELDHIAGLGVDWVWFLSVWQTGHAAQVVSRTNSGAGSTY